MKYLVTGGCGFVGSNLVVRLLERGDEVAAFDNVSREGSIKNLEWLRSHGWDDFVEGDIRDAGVVDRLVSQAKPDAILHLAGQVAMTASVNNPRADFEINAGGSINILEAVRRHCPEAAVVYSSSNKVYGLLESVMLREEPTRYSAPDHPNGLDESLPLDFQTPYGCSKGTADQYMLDYARVYNLNTVVFRHSTIFGGRQFATFDQGWIGWFCMQALALKEEPSREPFTISGDGKQVRDLLFVEDVVECYLAAVTHIGSARGQAFNIGGGIDNSSSLLELFAMLEKEVGIKMPYRRLPWRHSDQKYFVANNAKAASLLKWQPAVDKHAGIRKMLDWASRLL